MSTLHVVDGHPLIDEDIDLFALLCRRRGWSDQYLEEIESTEHAELLGLAEMVEALEDARAAGKRITIAPDFDMDGISSGVLGYAGLSELGFSVELHLPDYRRGHELTPEDIAEIHAKWPDTQVLLTCDGGVNSHRGIAAARARGWTTLVTDHHEELAPGSTADITVDPCRIDETYAHTGICGAHVLYQVIEAYTRVHRSEKLWEIRLLRLFAGLGTVSDVMPVLYENRQLVRDSISIARLLRVAAPKTIPNPWGGFDPDPDAIDVEQSTLMQLLRTEPHHPVFLRAFEGFAIVLKAFAQVGKIRDVDDLDEGFFGFYLAPAMNSPRRTGRPLDDCFAVFTAAGGDEKLKAARRVIESNELRKQLVIEHLEELTTGDQPLAPWVYFSHAYPGMYGLLANRMMELNGHPVVVVNRPVGPNDFISGSGRAPKWFDIITSLEPCSGISAIGHQQACGVRVERPERLGDLVAVLHQATQATQAALLAVGNDVPSGDLVLGPDADCDAGLDDLQPLFELVRRTESLKPFGQGFTAPVVEIAVEPLGLRVDRIGSEAQHLRLVTRSGLSCLWWNTAEEKFDVLQGLVQRASRTEFGTLRFTATLQLNTFRGDTRVQAVIAEQITRSA
ncbi:DHH family phosphoesterase [Streptomyces sp. NBC_01768]|uniref:DHH family phosphoesterase n=1 Tax=Streptomyces sp. NBC_01768 TaxID=2975938 RepID=UPI002DDBF69C|nr:DHH family phosphoesterase [Streptomyces sp. NBC_01768]WSC32276.1 DHH family phosphoesterase [Streptomyces sp. NBC_01768]